MWNSKCVREGERSTLTKVSSTAAVGVYGVQFSDVLNSDAIVSYDQQADQSTPARDYR